MVAKCYTGDSTLPGQTEDIARELAIALAEAMKALHTSDPVIIHRDIKPKNIIVQDDGSLALISTVTRFGIVNSGDRSSIIQPSIFSKAISSRPFSAEMSRISESEI